MHPTKKYKFPYKTEDGETPLERLRNFLSPPFTLIQLLADPRGKRINKGELIKMSVDSLSSIKDILDDLETDQIDYENLRNKIQDRDG